MSPSSPSLSEEEEEEPEELEEEEEEELVEEEVEEEEEVVEEEVEEEEEEPEEIVEEEDEEEEPEEEEEVEEVVKEEEEEEEVEEEEEEEEIEYVEVPEEADEDEEIEYEYVEVSEEEEEEPEPEEKEIGKDQSPNPKPDPDQEAKSSAVIKSITRLESLHSSLADFLRTYATLDQTLASISSSIDSQLVTAKPPQTDNDDHANQPSELESICKCPRNVSRAFRKYLTTRSSDVDSLAREVPDALKLSPNPEKLVLETVGKFYRQGIKAYENGDFHAIETRKASILLLGFYLMAGCPKTGDPRMKEEAKSAAVYWRSRMITEGGVENAGAEDALALVLLVAGFGIPSEFSTKDVYDLMRLAGLKEKGDLFRRSEVLVERVPGINN